VGVGTDQQVAALGTEGASRVIDEHTIPNIK